MMMEIIFQELAKAGINVATKELLTRVISKWGNSNLSGRKIVRMLHTDQNFISYLQNHVSRVVRLRTIHSADFDVFLHKIYHPLSIKLIEKNSDTLIVGDGFAITNRQITNIIGTAGQGKSTILRKIFLETLKAGEKVPFFLELRKIESDGIFNSFKDLLYGLGIRAENKDIYELLSSDKVILFLDGFDEISLKYREEILKEINGLNIKHGVQIITASRPGTLICHEAFVTNYEVNDLNKEDIISIIEILNISDSGIEQDQLPKIKEVIKRNENLISVMRTPILVTLFHVCYPFMDIIPKNTVEFYSSLFMTLYLRHDKIKNFDREKSAPLAHNEAYECFCALCFNTLYENVYDFNHNNFLTYTERALRIKNKLNLCKAEDLVSDFLNITCMIQKDGYDRYVFIHKSIQEYHAAEFVKSISSEHKNKFYNVIKEDFLIGSNKYNNVVSFLIEIDEINTAKNLTIPLCEYYGIDKWGNLSDVDLKIIYHEIMEATFFSIVITDNEVNSIHFNTLSRNFDWVNLHFDNPMHLPTLFDSVHNFLLHEVILNDYFFIKNRGLIESKRSYTLSHFASICEVEEKVIDIFKDSMGVVYDTVFLKNLDKIKNESISINEIFDL